MMRQLVIGALIGFFAAVLIVAALGTRSEAPVATSFDAGLAVVAAPDGGPHLNVMTPLKAPDFSRLRMQIPQRPVLIPVPGPGAPDAAR